MQNGDRYPVNEIFYSLQGEGCHTGMPAVFVRLSGCNLRCDFCDTDFSKSNPMNAGAIVGEVLKFPSRHVVITGGEPTLYDLRPLVDALHSNGCKVHIETNGTGKVYDGIDWVTVSPKLVERGGREYFFVDDSNFTRADELKVVFIDREGFAEMLEDVSRCFITTNKYLQPCSCLNTQAVVEYILEHPWWRLSLQTHKMINIQ